MNAYEKVGSDFGIPDHFYQWRSNANKQCDRGKENSRKSKYDANQNLA